MVCRICDRELKDHNKKQRDDCLNKALAEMPEGMKRNQCLCGRMGGTGFNYKSTNGFLCRKHLYLWLEYKTGQLLGKYPKDDNKVLAMIFADGKKH